MRRPPKVKTNCSGFATRPHSENRRMRHPESSRNLSSVPPAIWLQRSNFDYPAGLDGYKGFGVCGHER